MYTGHCSSGATHNGDRQLFLILVDTEYPFMIPQVYCPSQYHFLPSFRQRWALLGWTGISLGTAGFSSSMVVVPETLNWEREQSSRRRTGSRCLECLPKKSSIKVRDVRGNMWKAGREDLAAVRAEATTGGVWFLLAGPDLHCTVYSTRKQASSGYGQCGHAALMSQQRLCANHVIHTPDP